MLKKASVQKLRMLPSKPFPLGANYTKANYRKWQKAHVNFAVYSENASAIDLCLFDPANHDEEISRVRLINKEKNIWHTRLEGIKPGQPYAYRAYGPFNPAYNLRFNSHKLLLDPYSRIHDKPLKAHEDMFDKIKVVPKSEESDETKTVIEKSDKDSAKVMPRCIVYYDEFNWENDKKPNIPWNETIIYELHVKGFTKQKPDIPQTLRGTYAGLGHKNSIKYLKKLGINCVQIMPVHYHSDESFLIKKNLTNYWGYSSIGFFAPDIRYAYAKKPLDAVTEFKQMVKNLHSADIEVVLDVVYNHTGEGGTADTIMSFKGLDNTSYYRINSKKPSEYVDYTGCGNSLDINQPPVFSMVMDSLRYWAEEMRVDGFRFDLAVTLGREPDSFNRRSAFFRAIRQDSVLSKLKLIAEPWDLGMGGYQIGNHPHGWSELNGKFRDSIRSFIKSDERILPEFTSCFTGSEVIYGNMSKPPQSSINFVTSHDGFTLNDLVTYNEKHNENNGENNKDGDSHNHSWNCGIEGETKDAKINDLRWQQKRNFFTTLFLAQGVPLILAGDEISRTQNGNNNSYCQDNEISWINWQTSTNQNKLLEFVQNLIQLRKQYPVFRRKFFFRGKNIKGETEIKDIYWYRLDGKQMEYTNWQNPHQKSISVVICGKAMEARDFWRKKTDKSTFLLIFNFHHDNMMATIPPGVDSELWQPIIDTSKENFLNAILKNKNCKTGTKIAIKARSILVFKNLLPT